MLQYQVTISASNLIAIHSVLYVVMCLVTNLRVFGVPQEVNHHSLSRFLWILYTNLSKCYAIAKLKYIRRIIHNDKVNQGIQCRK